jgi:hypothetical protein
MMAKSMHPVPWVRPKLVADADLADLNMTLQPVPRLRALQLDFHKPVTVVVAQPAYALRLAQAFRRTVRDRYGRLSYDVAALPLMVFADDDDRRVVVRFHLKLMTLQAKPEVFLAWAERLRAVALAIQATPQFM